MGVTQHNAVRSGFTPSFFGRRVIAPSRRPPRPQCPKNCTHCIVDQADNSTWRALAFSAGGDGVGGSREHDYLERWCGGRALPWLRADVGFFGAHALSRRARVARMDSCDPLLATHFLLEKQVEARIPGCPVRSRAARLVAMAAEDHLNISPAN